MKNNKTVGDSNVQVDGDQNTVTYDQDNLNIDKRKINLSFGGLIAIVIASMALGSGGTAFFIKNNNGTVNRIDETKQLKVEVDNLKNNLQKLQKENQDLTEKNRILQNPPNNLPSDNIPTVNNRVKALCLRKRGVLRGALRSGATDAAEALRLDMQDLNCEQNEVTIP